MKNLKTTKILTLSLLLLLVTVLISFSKPKKTISITSLLNEMIDRDVVASFPQKDFRLKQESSYNRASVNPKDSEGWFTNKDLNNKDTDHNFIRIEENNRQKEWVLMDHKGTGAIVRTWMPIRSPKRVKTNSIIKIYLDGAKEPALKGNMLDLFNGTGLIPFPLAHKSLRSAVSFFPIPYAKSCKITVTERPFFYQFTFREYTKGTKVRSFTMEDFHKAKDQVKQVCETLIAPENILEGEIIKLKETLNTKEEKSIFFPKGNAAIRALSLKLGNYQDSLITRSVILKIEFDGQQTVWCPIGDFFGSGIGLNPFQGWYRTVLEDGTMSSRWVMPYQQSAKISVLNLSNQPVDIELDALTGDWKWDKNSLYFNAAWRGQNPVPTRPFSDWNYVTIKGRGVYVGDALTIMNPVEKWWGEGDEKIWIDGEDFPSIFGTGTEDYYGYSWGGMSTDFYEHPFHAQPYSHKYNKLNRKTIQNERNSKGFSTETRTRSLDVMPFGSSLQLDMEVWSWNDCDMAYGVGIYWDGDATTRSNRVPDEKGVMSTY
jgi:hypothetical protein